jgi:hypothetical protein
VKPVDRGGHILREIMRSPKILAAFRVLSLRYDLLLSILLEPPISFLKFQKRNELPDQILVMFNFYTFSEGPVAHRRETTRHTSTFNEC